VRSASPCRSSWFVGRGLADGGPFLLRSSLSGYYYSGARDLFVGILSALAVFLVTYKVMTSFPTFWHHYQFTCAGIIAAAIVVIAVSGIAGGPPKALLFGEAVAVWAFSASWLHKGLELDVLFPKPPADGDPVATARNEAEDATRPAVVM